MLSYLILAKPNNIHKMLWKSLLIIILAMILINLAKLTIWVLKNHRHHNMEQLHYRFIGIRYQSLMYYHKHNLNHKCQVKRGVTIPFSQWCSQKIIFKIRANKKLRKAFMLTKEIIFLLNWRRRIYGDHSRIYGLLA